MEFQATSTGPVLSYRFAPGAEETIASISLSPVFIVRHLPDKALPLVVVVQKTSSSANI